MAQGHGLTEPTKVLPFQDAGGRFNVALSLWDRVSIKQNEVIKFSPGFVCTNSRRKRFSLRVVLAYNDHMGSGTGPAAVDDLDLVVKQGGRTWYPNGRSGP